MKKYILAIVVAIACTTTNASKNKSYCENIYDLAEAVMSARQNGISLNEMRKIMKTDLSKALTLWAYSRPMYFDENLKKYEIDRFAERAFYGCKSVRKE